MFKKASILFYALVMIITVILDPFADRPRPPSSDGKHMEIELNRGMLTVLDFPSRKRETSALILFGSGDGGWSGFEESIAHTCQDQGYEVLGIDFHAYAETEYDLDILQSDYDKIAQTRMASLGKPPPPLIIGGYSMGAAQAIAVAGGPRPPQGLIGLLLIDPLSRGRYGLHASDMINVLPDGPGTFSAAAFSQTMGFLRIAQWHAEDDTIDSRSWLDSVTAPHKLYVFPNTGHFYNVNREDFLSRLAQSVQWILNPLPDGAVTERAKTIP